MGPAGFSLRERERTYPVHAGSGPGRGARVRGDLGSGTAAAQDLLSIEVTPLRVELTLKPGALHTQAVTLKNEGPKAVRVRARVDEWHLSRDGTPQFTFAEPAAPIPPPPGSA